MKTYKIQVLNDALEDMEKIIYYIKYTLLEPKIADEHKKAFLNEIDKLKISANIYQTLDKEIVGDENIKKMNVKNYMIFYNLVKKECLVQVIAVFYSRSNWKNKIKTRINVEEENKSCMLKG